MNPSITIAESRGLLRAGLTKLLSAWQPGPVHGGATLEAAMALMPQPLEPGAVLLVDLDLLGEAGPEGLHQVRRQAPGLRIIAMAARECRDGALACLAAGAHGYVAGTAEFAELVRAIEAVRAGGVHVPAALARPSATQPPQARVQPPQARAGSPAPPALGAAGLTNRQQDVLRLLAEGRSTKDIARTLDLAVSTIKVHLAALYRTVGARNRVEALCRAGILPALHGA